MPFNDGQDFVVCELARGLAHEALFVAKQGVKVEEVHTGEGGHAVSLLRWAILTSA